MSTAIERKPVSHAPRLPTSRAWWGRAVKGGFGKDFWVFLAVAILTGTACYLVRGAEEFEEALLSDGALILKTIPRVVAALTIAAILWVILPRDRISALIGHDSGIKGLLVAALAGAITPGGPSSAYPLLAMLGASGADRGALVAYITSWGILGLQRILVWDVPFLGAEFSAFRFAVSLPLPIIAGLAARALPIRMRIAQPAPDASA